MEVNFYKNICPNRDLEQGDAELREHEFRGILDKNKDGVADK